MVCEIFDELINMTLAIDAAISKTDELDVLIPATMAALDKWFGNHGFSKEAVKNIYTEIGMMGYDINERDGVLNII